MRSGHTTATAEVEAALRRLDIAQAATNALVSTDRDGALAAARNATTGPLAGVPVVLKDNLCQRGRPCTCGSRALERYVAPYDAHVVGLLKAAGAVIVGRANMDEFAMGSSNETSAWGPVRNPWDLARVPGGSSGGSATVVACGAVPVALGSDTGGSVRLPAAFTGTVGFKPSWGRVSRRGLVAFASSTDQVGPLTRDVRDAAVLGQVLAVPDPDDPTCDPRPVGDWLDACDRGVQGLRVGVPDAMDAEPAVLAAVEDCARALEAAGASLHPVAAPAAEIALACYYVLAPAEASANLARFDGVRYGLREGARSRGLGPEVKRRILVGAWVSSAGYAEAYYRRALRVRAALAAGLDEILAEVDVLLGPTAATTAFVLGERADPISMYRTDAWTVPASLAGLPAISVPWSLANGLPVGVQLTGRRFDEATLFAAAAGVEGAAPPRDLPPLWTLTPPS